MIRSSAARWLAVPALALAWFTFAACSDSEDEPPAPAVCSSVDALRASLAEINDIELSAGALAAVQESFDQVEADLRQVREDAADEYGSELDAVSGAADEVGSTLDAATADPSKETIPQVGVAIDAMTDSVSGLVDAVEGTC